MLKNLKRIGSLFNFYSWTDPYAKFNALASEMLGMPRTNLSSATKARKKYKVIKTIWKTSLKYRPSFHLIKEEAKLGNIPFPCVLKPISTSG